MQPLNAIDAVAPAFTRTHQTLFQPFRMGRSWKLATSSYLGWIGAMFVPWPLVYFVLPHIGPPGAESMRAILYGVGVVTSFLALLVLYLCGRMELVVFEMVVTRSKFIAPMWRRYSTRVWPWIGFKILIGTVYTAILAAIFFAPMRHMVQDMATAFGGFSNLPTGTRPDPQAIQAIMAPMAAQMVNLQIIGITLGILLKLPSTLLNDFVLPFYVLEDIPLFTAIGRGFQVFLADPVQVILYLILKPILFYIGYTVQSICLVIAMIPIVIVFVIVGLIATLIPHGGVLVAGVLVAIFAIAFALVVGYLVLFVTGYLLTLLEAYGIYFLAGRYPLLGNMLDPGPGSPFTPPPVFPSDEERNDDSGGPPMPMDPAVA